MKYALVNGNKTHAKDVNSGTIGNDIWFPEYEVKACVGKYRQYWVYTNGSPILPEGYEPESEWHSSWKASLIDEFAEVVCGENREHRADILTKEYAIEIQKSRICGFAVDERINFYKHLTDRRVIWIVNVFEPWKNDRIKTSISKDGKKNQFDIIWSRGWKWVIDIAKTTNTHLFLDVGSKGNNILKVWTFEGKLKGSWFKKVDFFDEFLKEYSLPEFQQNPELFVDNLKNI